MKLNLKSGSVYLNTGGVPWQDDKPWLCLVHGASLDHSVLRYTAPLLKFNFTRPALRFWF